MKSEIEIITIQYHNHGKLALNQDFKRTMKNAENQAQEWFFSILEGLGNCVSACCRPFSLAPFKWFLVWRRPGEWTCGQPASISQVAFGPQRGAMLFGFPHTNTLQLDCPFGLRSTKYFIRAGLIYLFSLSKPFCPAILGRRRLLTLRV